MNIASKYLFLAIVAGIVLGTASTTVPASAVKENAQDGLNRADENVHENTGPLSEQDFAFHEGICQGGHSTDVLDEVTDGEGCAALDAPGNSGDNRQDED
jgi:hypothetical protein